jgi:beta-ribofuranosylaminobenzene 5'-phosphate synthase
MQLTAYPRIHVGLADMGFVSQRAFGGIGFAINYPTTVIDFVSNDKFLLSGIDRLDEAASFDLTRILERLQASFGVRPFHARVLKHAPQHCGFGSKTSLALCLVAGANQLCALGLSRRDMQILSGRGGASGVGIHSFFDGGVICDGGHRMHPARVLLPSSANLVGEIPPLLSRLDFPQHWHVILLLGTAPALSREGEAAFFRQHAPVEREDALETVVSLHHGVLPAFATADYGALASALADLHSRGFKMRELMRCDEPTRRCFEALSVLGFPIGLSSVGPLLYVVVDKDDHDGADNVRREATANGLSPLGTSTGWNAGYEITGLLHEA